MEALRSAALSAMEQKQENIIVLSAKKEKALDKLTKIHVEIGYAKQDLERLEADYKNLVSRDRQSVNLGGCCPLPDLSSISAACKPNY